MADIRFPRKIFINKNAQELPGLDTGSCHQKAFIYLSDLFSYLFRSKEDKIRFS